MVEAGETILIPLVGGPGDGQEVRVAAGPHGRPPLVHHYGDALADAQVYELVADEDRPQGWRYEHRALAGNGGDFADEHSSVTLADEQPGGPEGVPEDDSPRGLSGAD